MVPSMSSTGEGSAPTRILGPARSARTAMGWSSSSDVIRTHSTIWRRVACEVCAMLMRKTSTPSEAWARTRSREAVAGPRVATILVLTRNDTFEVEEVAARRGACSFRAEHGPGERDERARVNRQSSGADGIRNDRQAAGGSGTGRGGWRPLRRGHRGGGLPPLPGHRLPGPGLDAGP